MNRIVISVFTLIIVFSLSLVGIISLNKTCESLAESLDEIQAAAIEEDREKCIELTDDILDIWEKKEVVISLLVDHREIDEIEQTIKCLPVFARQDNMERLEEMSSLASERVRHINHKEKIETGNIF